ncbi:NUDIX hydrolase [Actinoallomurus bryophytorum]|uniref:8-oxo-dGTP pyrophosphatase MutT (NUDIX family) n=1 Tax=Actinoallomurus bryophytorum TaxID=1490222 RepID=A0A543CF01_9ACTN|nr:NUDIX domain-containing protein [Actinoallomurus bryophytorum]TQL95570.1 8-oxo-dGTP pyrophosphatase MutT (NUDIX family) [Actinoallomurus bryophytorum]
MTAEVRAALHDDAVRVLSGWHPYDDGQDALRQEFLTHLATHADGMWRECVPGHLTASAAVLDSSGERVLLTLHPKAKMWLQLGGHCEHGDDSLAGAVLREAEEESGIEGLRLLPGPVRVDRHRVWCHGGSYHLDVQYAAVAPAGAQEKISDESDDLRWFALDAIPDLADDVLRSLATASREVFARHA